MKLTELIAKLQQIYYKHGDMPVAVLSYTSPEEAEWHEVDTVEWWPNDPAAWMVTGPHVKIG